MPKCKDLTSAPKVTNGLLYIVLLCHGGMRGEQGTKQAGSLLHCTLCRLRLYLLPKWDDVAGALEPGNANLCG